MHFKLLVAIASLSAIAHAQFNGLPKCAQACVGNSLVEFGCSNYNPKCICENKDLIAALACCVGKSCTSQTDIENTETFANQICKPYGVTLPAAATCAPGVSILATTTGGTPTPSSTSTSATTTTSTMGGAAGNGTAVTSAPKNGTAATTGSSSTTPQSTGGAPMQTMAAGFGAAAFGLLAVL